MKCKNPYCYQQAIGINHYCRACTYMYRKAYNIHYLRYKKIRSLENRKNGKNKK